MRDEKVIKKAREKKGDREIEQEREGGRQRDREREGGGGGRETKTEMKVL